MNLPDKLLPQEALLDLLVDDLSPRAPLRLRPAALALAALIVLGAVLVALWLGARADIVAGRPSGMLVLRTAMLLGLGGLCAAAALQMARPGVGAGSGRFGRAWQAALLMALGMPLAGAVQAWGDPVHLMQVLQSGSALWCLGVSMVGGLAVAALIALQLRRGAPVVPERAALVTGLASGSCGVLIYSVHCPWDSLVYIGLWYSLAVALVALICRLALPRLIRW